MSLDLYSHSPALMEIPQKTLRNGGRAGKISARENHLTVKKLYPSPDFVGRTYLSSIAECLPSANLSKADKTPYYKSKLLKLG